MKIVLDIDKLLADGQMSAGEYERLKGFSRKETGSLAFNILIGFGVIATAGGALALFYLESRTRTDGRLVIEGALVSSMPF